MEGKMHRSHMLYLLVYHLTCKHHKYKSFALTSGAAGVVMFSMVSYTEHGAIGDVISWKEKTQEMAKWLKHAFDPLKEASGSY